MNKNQKIDILTEMKQLLCEHFPNNIEKVILFGSRNNGNHKEYSDYDILIVLKNDYDWRLKNKIYDVTYDIDLKYEILTDIKIISQMELNAIKGKQPFIINALETGLCV